MERETAQRIWAAGAYANLTKPKLAERLGLSVDTLKGRLAGTRGFRQLESEEELIRQVAKITELPLGFFTESYWLLEDARRQREIEGAPPLAPGEKEYIDAVGKAIAGAMKAVEDDLTREVKERLERTPRPASLSDEPEGEDGEIPDALPDGPDRPPDAPDEDEHATG